MHQHPELGYVDNAIHQLNTDDTPIVMTFGHISGGHTLNVIPSKINLRGSIRYLDVDLKKVSKNKFVNPLKR